MITAVVSDLTKGADFVILPVVSCQSMPRRRAWRCVKGATHLRRSKAYPFKLEGQRTILIPLLFGITVWDPGIGVEVFIEQPWDLRTNPFEEGEFDAWGTPSQCPKINQG